MFKIGLMIIILFEIKRLKENRVYHHHRLIMI